MRGRRGGGGGVSTRLWLGQDKEVGAHLEEGETGDVDRLCVVVCGDVGARRRCSSAKLAHHGAKLCIHCGGGWVSSVRAVR